VHLLEIGEQALHEVQRMRPLGMAGELNALPGRVKLRRRRRIGRDVGIHS